MSGTGIYLLSFPNRPYSPTGDIFTYTVTNPNIEEYVQLIAADFDLEKESVLRVCLTNTRVTNSKTGNDNKFYILNFRTRCNIKLMRNKMCVLQKVDDIFKT